MISVRLCSGVLENFQFSVSLEVAQYKHCYGGTSSSALACAHV